MTGPDAAPQPGDVEDYRPCVGVALTDGRGRLFAGQRRDASHPAWQMPQGGIEPGESPRAAALRELREETGIPASSVQVLAESDDWHRYDLPAELQGRMWGGRWKGQRQKWLLLRYLGSEDEIRLDGETPEFSAWGWLEPAALLAAIVPFKRDVYRAVLAEFAPLLAAHAPPSDD